MFEAPWLSIIGLGEDGVDGLCAASRNALETAEIVMGPPRHLALLPSLTAEAVEWPVPFADGVSRLMAFRGRKTVVLASGDPFWFGAGTTLAAALDRDEWTAFPGRSTFSFAAARLGWPLERTICLGLHAAPISQLRPHLAPGQCLIVLLRDGEAVADLADYLSESGFGASTLTVLEALGGPREAITTTQADAVPGRTFAHPVCVSIEVTGDGASLPLSSGRPDSWFENDGQITKRPIRALTLSALAPRPHEHLWDIGGGSGSIALEWLLSDPSMTATCIEPKPERAATIRTNADRLGMDRLEIVEDAAPDCLPALVHPSVIFIGGGLSQALLDWLATNLPSGTRLVANAVTLESEALLTDAAAQIGGELLRVELSSAAPIGPKRGWKTSYPIVQWSHTL